MWRIWPWSDCLFRHSKTIGQIDILVNNWTSSWQPIRNYERVGYATMLVPMSKGLMAVAVSCLPMVTANQRSYYRDRPQEYMPMLGRFLVPRLQSGLFQMDCGWYDLTDTSKWPPHCKGCQKQISLQFVFMVIKKRAPSIRNWGLASSGYCRYSDPMWPLASVVQITDMTIVISRQLRFHGS